MENIEEWHKIGNILAFYFDTCSCQRKLKSIIDSLYIIYQKIESSEEKGVPISFTGSEYLLISIMDSKNLGINHGINIEYPILIRNTPFWKWILEVKDSPYLEDN